MGSGAWTPTSDSDASPRAIRLAAIELGLRERGEEHTLDVEAATIAELNDQDISHGWTRAHEIATCTPPVRTLQPFDREARWESLQGERFDAFLAASGPVIWNDSAGAGKTTSAALASADRGLNHALTFPTHEKAREHILGDATPDGYFHLKGPEQPLHDCCLDAKIAADDDEDAFCQEHGKETNWPRMCPLRELPENNETRLQFEALSAVIPLGEAHKQFCGDCPWSEQFDGLEDQERVAGVHEHQKLLSDMGFTIIVDETPRVLGDEQTWTGVDLRRAGTLLRSFDTEHAQALGEFVRTDLLDAVVEGSFDGLTPPDIGAYDIAEKLTRLKIAYNEELELRIESGTWDGTPPCFDALIAALAEIGVPPTACREVIAAPSTLAKCPHCGAPTTTHDGVRECVACFWEKARFDILPYENRDRTRALAYLQTDADPNVTENGLCYLSLPDPSSFPDSPLILDATATPEKIAGLYDVPVAVYGDERCELNANVVQIGNGAYHPGTIRGAFKDERRRLNDRLQQAIDVIVDRYEKPLFITKSDLLSLFNFPDHAKTRYYSGLRGLNLQECDAVICIGAPHPNIRNIENQARLLAMDHPDLEVGGDEHGTRDGAPNPPIYRKLYYADENGRGRAVPTKHFTGLAGKLFYEAREKELEQAVHRIRPLLADETKDIYLLTNVPTTLPVDEFVELDAISDEPLAAHLPVPGDVIPYLLKPLHNLSTDEDCDGVDVTDETISARISGLHTLARESGADWSETTAWRRVKKLEELGLINKPLYIRDRGYRYDIDRAAISRVLLVTSSTCEKAEAVSRFRSKTRAADGSLDWLDWAYDEFVDADTKFQKFC